MLPPLRLAATAVAALAAVAGVRAAPQQPLEEQQAQQAQQADSGLRACNNSPTLCGRKYNQMTHMGAHDSSFLRGQGGIEVAGNQRKNATLALDAGLRLLQAQVHKPDSSALRLCHSSCGLLDAGPLDAWLAAVGSWMSANPNDVVTLLLVNSDKAPATDFAAAFERAGLSALGYQPPSASATADWPTLDAMIGQGKRLVSFVTNMDALPSAPYLLPEFNYVFETPFEVTQISGFNCTLQRPAQAGPAAQAVSSGYLSLVNHFKYQPIGNGFFNAIIEKIGGAKEGIMVPDEDKIATVNSTGDAEGSLGRHVSQCQSEWGRQPNFVLVDFWDRGGPMQVADSANALTSTAGRKSVSVQSTGSVTGLALGGLEGGALGVALLAFALLMA